MSAEARRFALGLYAVSVLKQAKVRAITGMLGDTEGLRCLDLGGDNGVVSLLLRERGGSWASADLDERTVASIRELVGTDVARCDGSHLPFPDAAFDRVVIVDMLEHIEEDRALVKEVRRVLRPEGRLLVNVPHLKPHSLLNRVRHAAGLTDEKHGHVRPGYSVASLREVLAPHFVLVRHATYSRFFSEGIDTAMTLAYEATAQGKTATSRKGTVVTQADTEARKGSFRALRAAYPVLRAVASLDGLLFLQPGYKLIAEAVPA
ncbi:MAG TPA: class I SAM-dependent methyltransferase [Candidatus Polarisedimenticolaceae bacterium]|nr:class I SAM-dependent methyltransferase [Candidatus Polarisedimenticolaceae bacterium]